MSAAGTRYQGTVEISRAAVVAMDDLLPPCNDAADVVGTFVHAVQLGTGPVVICAPPVRMVLQRLCSGGVINAFQVTIHEDHVAILWKVVAAVTADSAVVILHWMVAAISVSGS